MRTAALLFISFLVLSCFEQGDCLLTNSVTVKVSLKNFTDKKTAISVTYDSVYIPQYATLYKAYSNSALLLPLDSRRSSMEFVFVRGGKPDTIAFTYRNEVVVLSPECGAVPFYHDLILVKSTFGTDRVAVVNPELLKNVVTNVDIYY